MPSSSPPLAAASRLAAAQPRAASTHCLSSCCCGGGLTPRATRLYAAPLLALPWRGRGRVVGRGGTSGEEDEEVVARRCSRQPCAQASQAPLQRGNSCRGGGRPHVHAPIGPVRRLPMRRRRVKVEQRRQTQRRKGGSLPPSLFSFSSSSLPHSLAFSSPPSLSPPPPAPRHPRPCRLLLHIPASSSSSPSSSPLSMLASELSERERGSMGTSDVVRTQAAWRAWCG